MTPYLWKLIHDLKLMKSFSIKITHFPLKKNLQRIGFEELTSTTNDYPSSSGEYYLWTVFLPKN